MAQISKSIRAGLAAALTLVSIVAAPALAQTKDRLESRGALLGWEAVGRLDLPGGTCTGALIARDLVLTAAHCVVDKRTGAPLSGPDIIFRAAFANGREIAARRGARLAIDPRYRPARDGKISGAMIPHDIALLELARPIHEVGVDPYAIYDGTTQSKEVILASYGKGRLDALTLERGCKIRDRYRQGIFGFDCDATFGSSGAPVFARQNGRIRIVSILSAIGESDTGQFRAFGMSLPKKVAQLKVALRNAPPVRVAPRRLGVSGALGGAGNTRRAGRFVSAVEN